MTTRFKYLRWDGTQSGPELDAEDYFDEFSNYLMEGWTPDEAYEWMLKQGIGSDEYHAHGIDELRAELSAYRQSIFETYNLEQSLSAIRRELEDILYTEISRLDSQLSPGSEEFKKRAAFLEKLDRKLSQAIESLEDYDFLDPEALEKYKALKAELERIRKVEKFINRLGEKFSGDESIGFEETLELISRLEGLDRIERMLISGELAEISADELKDVLSEKGLDSIVMLKSFKSTLEDRGLVVTTGERTELTPKGIRKIGEKTLGDIFSALKRRKLSEHETGLRGSGTTKHEETKEYEFGAPFNLNIVGTLKNSLAREPESKRSEISPESGIIPGIDIKPGDFEVYETEYQTHAATALLLDLSWSMSFQGRFPAAKRVALALDHLIKIKYAKDDFYLIGFSTGARPLSTKELAVSTWDSNDPFTNIQEALAVAAKTLSKHKNSNKQIILVTDGQPTAYHTDGYLQVELPMFFGGLSPRATLETLKEVKRVTGLGIRINTFMLDDSASLRRFVKEMTRINKGRAFFTTPDQLGKYLLVDYLKRKRQMF
jgi:uncharacterized protein with von Willebrand factor type A (vWA) domain